MLYVSNFFLSRCSGLHYSENWFYVVPCHTLRFLHFLTDVFYHSYIREVDSSGSVEVEC